MNSIKKIIPDILKYYLIQFYLRKKFRKHNKIGKNVIFNKTVKMGKKCHISDSVILGANVVISDGVNVSRNVHLENIYLSENSMVDMGVQMTGYGNGKITVGKESYLGIYNVLDWSDNIIIGDFVHIAGPSTGLWTHTSYPMCLNSIPLENKPLKFRPVAPIVIEDNVYIGGNCSIYPGVTISHHSIVAPNSAVTKDVESYTMVGGVPARKIKDIKKI